MSLLQAESLTESLCSSRANPPPNTGTHTHDVQWTGKGRCTHTHIHIHTRTHTHIQFIYPVNLSNCAKTTQAHSNRGGRRQKHFPTNKRSFASRISFVPHIRSGLLKRCSAHLKSRCGLGFRFGAALKRSSRGLDRIKIFIERLWKTLDWTKD